MKQVLAVGVAVVLVITLVAFGIHPVTEPLPQINVALYTGNGTISRSTSAIQNVLGKYDDLVLSEVKESDITGGALKQYRVLIVPGGSGSGIRDALGKEGCRAIEKFVSQGGGFIGICAGAYLPTLGWKESMQDLQLVNTRLHDLDNWARGKQTIKCMALTKSGKNEVPFQIHFENGPIFVPGNDPYLPPYVSLAKFETDLHASGAPSGQMKGRDAIVASRFGRGRVILFSPHPEFTPGLEGMLSQATRWSAGQCEPGTAALGPEYSWEGIFGILPLPQTE